MKYFLTMDWSSPAYVLSFRPLGERDAVANVLSREHGRYAGLIRGGQSQKHQCNWQIGHLVNATWRARLSEHLGSFSGEVIRNNSAHIFDSPLGLAMLFSATALIDSTVPERMPLPQIFDSLTDVLPLDDDAIDVARFVCFENDVLYALGYGLDLSCCALTGSREDLAYVSPKTGRAVNRIAAKPWAHKLLPLPDFMHSTLSHILTPAWDDVLHGLALTSHFIEQNILHHLATPVAEKLRAKRQRVIDLATKQSIFEMNSAEISNKQKA